MLERLHSPAFLLASFLSNRKGIPELILVTGRSGCGKTTWCLDLVEQAWQAGISPLGMLSPPASARLRSRTLAMGCRAGRIKLAKGIQGSTQ